MIYNEDFVVLEEDEDIEAVEDKVLLEGECLVLDEAYLPIKASSDVNPNSNVEADVKRYKEYISSDGYREFKSSDSQLLTKAIKEKQFISILGTALTTIGIVGVSKLTKTANKKISDKKIAKSRIEHEKQLDRIDKKYDKQKSAVSDDTNKKALDAANNSNLSQAEFDLHLINLANDEDKAHENIENDRSREKDTQHKKHNKEVIDAWHKEHNTERAINVASGIGVGGAVISGIASILKTIKYSVFNYKGMNVISFRPNSDKVLFKSNAGLCYMILVKTDGKKEKVVFKRIKSILPKKA